MIREALEKAESLGATALSSDSTKGQQRITALDNPKATRALQPHTYYLTSVLGTRESISFEEARRLLGYCGEGYAPKGVAAQRDVLMERAGWPSETLTFEELEARYG